MNQDWQNFLSPQSAHLQEGIAQHFGDAAAERIATRDGTIRCDLSQFGLLKVTGEDAQSFLQNLLSNDIREVTSNRAQLSSFNNAKGRMLASMLIWRDDNDYVLQLHHSLCEPIRKKLSMYVLRSKVKIVDVSTELVCIGVAGADALKTIQARYPALPQQAMDVVVHGEDNILCREEKRFQITTTPQRAIELWQALSTLRAVGSPCWDWLDIRAGVPFVQTATFEAFVPQMLNFEVIGGVNFKKGCYPGQEIVARMHYLGKAKRRMYLAHIEDSVEVKAGDALFSTVSEEQSCGTVVDAQPSPNGGIDLLAVVQTASHESASVHLGKMDGPQLHFLSLPYALP
ncbi:MAG: folate-binding protein YgfZ [Gallionellaceae bacterium]|nr:MAG: folate-binding protein YgfZ [Gallionellaceae bacterium]